MEIHDITIFWGSHQMKEMEQDLKDLCDNIREARAREGGYNPAGVPDSCMIMGILKVYSGRWEKKEGS